MRILLIHNFYQWRGGEDNYVVSLQNPLKEKGHEVYLYSKDSAAINTSPDKIKTALNLYNNRSGYHELSDVIRKFKPDIAQIQNMFPLISYSAYEACTNNKVPIIQRISNFRFLCPKGTLFRNNSICELCVNKTLPLYSVIHGCYHQSCLASLFLSGCLFLNRKKIKNDVGAYIFPSAFIKEYYRKFLALSPEAMFVIPTFTPHTTRVNIPKKKDYFLYVGRLSEEKGILFLLNQFRQLPRLKIKIIGDGPLRNKVDQFKKFNNITVLGQVSKHNVARHMADALMTVIPSQSYDVLPHTLIESFRQGTPVIVPDFGSFPILVKNMKTGLVYSPNDGESIKKCLLYAHKHRQVIQNTFYDVLEAYKNSYTSDRHYSLLMNVYKKTVFTLKTPKVHG